MNYLKGEFLINMPKGSKSDHQKKEENVHDQILYILYMKL